MTLRRRDPTPTRSQKLAQRQKRMRTMAASVQPRPGVVYGGSTAAAPKPAPMLQHHGYMAAVRGLGYCMLCRRACRPQFCHRDQTKGMGLKTDVREGWPGCAECHWRVGTSGEFPKEERRALELDLGRRTREAVKAAGTWPAGLPLLDTESI